MLLFELVFINIPVKQCLLAPICGGSNNVAADVQNEYSYSESGWRNKATMGRDDLLDRTQARVLEIFWTQNLLDTSL